MKLEDFKQRKFKHGVVYLGDCEDVLRALGRNSSEVCVTSPPYNLCKRYVDYKTEVSKKMTKKFAGWYVDETNEWKYQGEQAAVIDDLLRVCRSSIFYNHKIRYSWHGRNQQGKYETSKIFEPLQWIGRFPIWCRITWDRGGIRTPIKNRYHQSEELIYQIGKNMKFYQKKGKDSFKTIWRFPPSGNDDHVCTFPEKLVENCIFPTTDIGDTVIDPYLGSGTTAVVAVKHGRRFIGIENDHEYFATACRNIQKAEDERDRMEKEGNFYFQPHADEPFDMAKIYPDGLERFKGKLGTPVRAWIKKEEKRKAKEKAERKKAKRETKRIKDILEWEKDDQLTGFKPSRTFNLENQKSEKITYKKEVR